LEITATYSTGFDEARLAEIAELKKKYSSLVIQLDRLRSSLIASPTTQRRNGKWSLREILGHLIDVDREIWGPRIETMLQEDHPHFESISQDELVIKNRWNDFPIEEIIAQLMRVRWNLAVFINNLPDVSLARTCHHYSAGDITIADILQILVDHDSHHIQQIKDILQRESS